MDAHPNIRFQQIVLPFVIGHPIAKKEMGIKQSQLLCQCFYFARHPHPWHNRRVQVLLGKEEELHIRANLHHLGQGVDKGEGIEPVPQTTAPQNQFVISPNARMHTFERRFCLLGRCGGQTKGNHIDQPAQGFVSGVVARIHPTNGPQHPQPIVPLAVAGTDEEVAHLKLAVENALVQLMDIRLPFDGQVAVDLQIFQGERVIDVHNQRFSQIAQSRQFVDQVAKGEHNIGQIDQMDNTFRFGSVIAFDLKALSLQAGRAVGGQCHVKVLAQCFRHLPIAHSRTGHFDVDLIVGDQQQFGRGRCGKEFGQSQSIHQSLLRVQIIHPRKDRV